MTSIVVISCVAVAVLDDVEGWGGGVAVGDVDVPVHGRGRLDAALGAIPGGDAGCPGSLRRDLRVVVETHDGRVVKTNSDGVHAVFEAASDALAAAVSVAAV